MDQCSQFQGQGSKLVDPVVPVIKLESSSEGRVQCSRAIPVQPPRRALGLSPARQPGQGEDEVSDWVFLLHLKHDSLFYF